MNEGGRAEHGEKRKYASNAGNKKAMGVGGEHEKLKHSQVEKGEAVERQKG